MGSNPKGQLTANAGVREACRKHAADLLKGADALLEAKQPHLAYHFAALAIEEIGKAFLTSAQLLVPEPVDESNESKLDDHEAKLMWGLWLPSFASAAAENKNFDDTRKMAKDIHQRRLAGLYVDVGTLSSAGPPKKRITKTVAVRLMELAKARLKLERRFDPEEMIVGKDDLRYLWSLRNDPLRKWAWSKASFDKLRDLKGDMAAWIAWIRDQDAEARKAGAELVRKQMELQAKGDHSTDDPIWKFKIRIHSPSHSFRQKPLNLWNDANGFLQLTKAKQHELLLSISVPRGVEPANVYYYVWGLARQFVAALCIGSTGYFWWEAEHDPDAFYEEVENIEDPQLAVTITRTPSLKVTWRKTDVVKENEIGRTALMFYAIGQLAREKADEIFGNYIGGLIFIAKSNTHLAFEREAFHRFRVAFQSALKEYSSWDGMDASFVERVELELRRFFPKGLSPDLVALLKTDCESACNFDPI